MNEQTMGQAPSGAAVGVKTLSSDEVDAAMMTTGAAMPTEGGPVRGFDPRVLGIISNVALRRQRDKSRLVIHSDKDPGGATFLTPAQWLLVSTHNQQPPELEDYRKMVLAMAGLYTERLNYPLTRTSWCSVHIACHYANVGIWLPTSYSFKPDDFEDFEEAVACFDVSPDLRRMTKQLKKAPTTMSFALSTIERARLYGSAAAKEKK